MIEQWQELKETITEMRDNDGTSTQQDVCKFLANYMEILEKQMQQPTEKCKGCYYNDGDTHTECVVCDKETQPTDEVKCDCATEEIANSFIADVEAVEDQLEAQPCEDAISREAVLKGLASIAKAKAKSDAQKSMVGRCMFFVEHLPSVTPKGVTVTDFADKCRECGKIQNELSEDCISREAVIKNIKGWFDKIELNPDILIDSIITLPSVTPERLKGKWIEIEIDAGEFIYKCTKCGMRVINPYKYCPICGSYNGGGEE